MCVGVSVCVYVCDMSLCVYDICVYVMYLCVCVPFFIMSYFYHRLKYIFLSRSFG